MFDISAAQLDRAENLNMVLSGCALQAIAVFHLNNQGCNNEHFFTRFICMLVWWLLKKKLVVICCLVYCHTNCNKITITNFQIYVIYKSDNLEFGNPVA